ncbi:proto-oncogene vav-like isoform X2 [Conger conger]|uniref:proto-oncogene vav-like isoform X2 n=1 Tax=Conger conger TaxID=82655 RepID=UPI002A5AD8A2|nr:proto-oncogene vav-like isoform X2 [Conger conger]
MELWRQCAAWLIRCRVLPENHRVTWDSAQVCDLAHALRDGVLLCQLLHNLLPQSINLKDINLRPQMSQFLCLKNIRTFLSTCQSRFRMKKSELFEAFDLFDVRDFGKVIDTLSSLSYTQAAIDRGIQAFPLEGSVPDEEIYSGLSDQIDDTADEDDDLYDCVEDEIDEGDEIYEDLMRADVQEHKAPEVDKRHCCLQEIRSTEEKYTETLESILKHFMKPLQRFLQPQDIENIFINVKELASTHRSLLEEIRTSILNCGAENLYQVFISYKERLLPYGRYCSQIEAATKHLDKMASTKEDVRMKLEECSKRANSGRFSLRDLLMVPMQRVLKYHLLLQELVKHTTNPAEKDNLRTALDAMRDLAQCVNEVKRDNEILRQITTFQLSIENMTQSLALYGRPKIDGELKILSSEKRSKQDRYAFLFDRAMLVCKRKSGDNLELKKLIELQNYQVKDELGGERDNKKWSSTFYLLDTYDESSFDLYFKTKELKRKWLEQFQMALSNIFPDNHTANNHDFQMYSFEDTTSCKACCMLLRGIFFQGYRCSRCKVAAHKECLGRVPACGRSSDSGTMKKNKNQRSGGSRQSDPVLPKLEGRNMTVGETGWFPASKVRPFIPRPTPDLTAFHWFAGTLDRAAAKNLLQTRSDGTYLVRQKDAGEFAVSIKFKMEIKHIKITSSEGLFRINEKKAFKGLIDLVEFYQTNTLKEYFKDLDTPLQFPFKEPEQGASPPSPAGGSVRYTGTARARYDFSARDRTELSLREGDTVKIISKKSTNGWLKGEVYGRVGLFPANYVEEEHSDYC